jgi:hypothetical protein
MLYQLEVLEARHIADLASDARKVRDRLLEKVPEADLGEPMPARGEHNPSSSVTLRGVLETEPEFVALRQAIAAIPRDIREKLWVVAQTGRGNITIGDWDETIGSASMLADDAITADLLGDTDLHDHLHKGLYELGATSLPGDGR